MVRRFKSIIPAALCLLGGFAVCSCAKDEDESNRSVQERILDAYIASNCPLATKLSSGLTIINENEPDGATQMENLKICYVHYDTYSLDGTCQSTTDSVKARELGTYDQAVYYGPVLFSVGYGSSSKGMEELLLRMSEGGTITAIMPPWLTSYSSTSSGTTSSSQESSVNVIYKIRMMHVISDLTDFQTDSLEAYSRKYFEGMDSLKSGFYFKNYVHPRGIASTDTVETGTSVNVWYIGRLLDGYVFDTNIEDTAKKYGLYDSDSDYTPLEIEMESTYQETAENNDNNMNTSSSSSSSSSSSGGYIVGFAKALKGMTFGDLASTFFSSGWGYGSSSSMSSGKGVPEYSMLRFDLIMVDEDDDDYPPKTANVEMGYFPKGSSAAKPNKYLLGR